MAKEFVIEMADIELKELKSDLKKGDSIIEETSLSGKLVRYSDKTSKARISFLKLVLGLLESSTITAAEATQATQYFGKKTTSLYWIK